PRAGCRGNYRQGGWFAGYCEILCDALALQQNRGDLLQREIQAGWHQRPTESRNTLQTNPLVDSFLYTQLLGDVMQSPVQTTTAETSLLQAAQQMVANGIGSLLVLDASHTLCGIITERDLLRASCQPNIDLSNAPVGTTMSTPVRTMRPHDPLYRVLARMAHQKIRHIPAVDDRGAIVGIVSERDLLRYRADAANVLGDRIALAESSEALASVHRELHDLATRLVGEGITGLQVARIVSAEVRAMTARAAELSLEQLGPAPSRWCLLVLGSAGRGESLLSADQDNALIFDGDPNDDAWFARFGESIEQILDQAGIPSCMGGVMASREPWRGTPDQWDQRVESWIRRSSRADLLNVDIFFDLYPVAGDEELFAALRDKAVEHAQHHPPFLALLAEGVADMRAPIGLFGQFKTQAGRIDLKMGGLLPLVSVARVLALQVGSVSRASAKRFQAAAQSERLNAADTERLNEVHQHLLTLILKQQLRDIDDRVAPSSRVAVTHLTHQERRSLKNDLQWLADVLLTLRATLAN
ncbi:MAG: DUF294 nucleotidyltransferase-like domain-containing protein, partial [Pseudomonadota bacterium]